MKQATLYRFEKTRKQTLGELFIDGDYLCKTLELADKNNQADISCIPEGRYVCKYTRSNRLSMLMARDFYTYEVMNVPNRSGIRIHSANFAYQLLGCIALGSAYADINGDGTQDLVNSRISVKLFEETLNKEDFILTITSEKYGV